MYGPLIVLEPGEHFNPELDRILVIADAIDGDHYNTIVNTTINGKRDPPTLTLLTGTEYRLRFINISEGTTVDISLSDASETLSWYALAKDGAVLPPVMQREVSAEFRTQTGETYDFLWRPTAAMHAKIVVDNNFGVFGTLPGRLLLTQRIRVVDAPTAGD